MGQTARAEAELTVADFCSLEIKFGPSSGIMELFPTAFQIRPHPRFADTPLGPQLSPAAD